jgi:MOSC domain-containing protein YiiM
MPTVAHLFRAPKKHLPMAELDSVEIVADRGLADCAHGRPSSKRQVLLVDKETLDAMNLQPGVIRENITTIGLNVNGLAIGERLRIGPALLEVTGACTPCDQLEQVRPGLRREIYGRRGMLCRVIEGGIVHRGDGIQRVPLAAAAQIPD